MANFLKNQAFFLLHQLIFVYTGVKDNKKKFFFNATLYVSDAIICFLCLTHYGVQYQFSKNHPHVWVGWCRDSSSPKLGIMVQETAGRSMMSKPMTHQT